MTGGKRLYAPMALAALILAICAGTIGMIADDSVATDWGTAESPLSDLLITAPSISKNVPLEVYVKNGGSVSILGYFEEEDGIGRSRIIPESITSGYGLSISSYTVSDYNVKKVTGTLSRTGDCTVTLRNIDEDLGEITDADYTTSIIIHSIADPSSKVLVTSISISGSTSIVAGSTTTLSATVSPTTATDKSVTWSSSNTSVASIDPSSGLVTAKSAGSTTITCKANDDSGKTATKSITVKALTVSLSGSTSGKTATQYSYTVSSNAGSTSLSVSPTSGCSISGSSSPYTLTFDTAGTYTLTATATNGSVSVTAKKTVTITANSYSLNYYVNGSIAKTDGPYESSEASRTFTVSYTPTAQTNATFKGWAESSGGTTVKYSSGGTVTLYSSSPTKNLYAVFEYTPSLSFVATGATGTPSKMPYTVYTTSDISVPIPEQEPEITGKIFKGWATVSGGTPAYSSASSSLGLKSTYALKYNESATLYAVFATGHTSTLKYNVGDALFTGQDYTSDPSESASSVTVDITTAVPESTSGYVFKGWALSASGNPVYGYLTGLKQTIEIGADKSVTLYAIWYAKVAYDGNGGVPSKESDEVKPGNQVVLATATKADVKTSITGGYKTTAYELLGWSKDPNSSKADTGYTPGARIQLYDCIDLYAIWKEVSSTTYYTVTFDPNGGTCGTTTLEGVVSSLPTATREQARTGLDGGYRASDFTFLGWSDVQSATTAKYTAGSSMTPTSDVKLYAIWKEDTSSVAYTVTYDIGLDGKDPIVDPCTGQAYSKSRTVKTIDVSRDGYVLKGWSLTEHSATVGYTAGEVFDVTGDTVLYAVWARTDGATEVTVTFDSNGGSAVGAITVKLGESVKLPSVSMDGKTFDGWYIGSEKIGGAGESYTPSSSVKLTAHWTDISDGEADTGKSGGVDPMVVIAGAILFIAVVLLIARFIGVI